VVKTSNFTVETRGESELDDITSYVENELRKSGLREGLATIFVSGSTAGITTVEFEPGLIKDIKRVFEKLVPEGDRYAHNDTWHDGNGHSHVRSSILKTSLSVPFQDAKLLLGTWQQIVLIDFDNRKRSRKVIAQFIGE